MSNIYYREKDPSKEGSYGANHSQFYAEQPGHGSQVLIYKQKLTTSTRLVVSLSYSVWSSSFRCQKIVVMIGRSKRFVELDNNIYS